MREVKFDIDAPEFANAKLALNTMMQGLLHAIMRGQTEDGTVTLKIDIAAEETGEGLQPMTEFKCTVSYKRKDDVGGIVHGKHQVTLKQDYTGEICGVTDAPEQIAMEGV